MILCMIKKNNTLNSIIILILSMTMTLHGMIKWYPCLVTHESIILDIFSSIVYYRYDDYHLILRSVPFTTNSILLMLVPNQSEVIYWERYRTLR